MARKKNRAFFICPRWNEVAAVPGSDAADTTSLLGVNHKTLAAITGGLPVARSTLRKALQRARQASGSPIDIDAYIVDQRAARSR